MTSGVKPQPTSNSSIILAGTTTPKRTKERTIADIIDKVSLWRRMYNGIERDGNIVRYSLEDAAVKVGISKKSLDDYLLQLRFGKKFGFDFQKNRQEMVGCLRKFVKNAKEYEKNESAYRKNAESNSGNQYNTHSENSVKANNSSSMGPRKITETRSRGGFKTKNMTSGNSKLPASKGKRQNQKIAMNDNDSDGSENECPEDHQMHSPLASFAKSNQQN